MLHQRQTKNKTKGCSSLTPLWPCDVQPENAIVAVNEDLRKIWHEKDRGFLTFAFHPFSSLISHQFYFWSLMSGMQQK